MLMPLRARELAVLVKDEVSTWGSLLSIRQLYAGVAVYELTLTSAHRSAISLTFPIASLASLSSVLVNPTESAYSP